MFMCVHLFVVVCCMPLAGRGAVNWLIDWLLTRLTLFACDGCVWGAYRILVNPTSGDPVRMKQNLCLQCFHLVLANCTKSEFLAVQSQQLVELLHYIFTVISSNPSLLVSLTLFFISFFCCVSFLRHLWCFLLLGPVFMKWLFLSIEVLLEVVVYSLMRASFSHSMYCFVRVWNNWDMYPTSL